MDNRIEKAREKFRQGFNCAQSVFFAFAENDKISVDLALKISCGFGAGMAREQEVCGAVSGAIMAIGLKYGRGSADEALKTEETYKIIDGLTNCFKRTYGTLQCREILGNCDLKSEGGQKYFEDNDLFNTKCIKCVTLVSEYLDKLK